MTATQKMWLAVIKRMAVAFPRSPYAELGAKAVETAQIWSAELPSVPYDAVQPLYERLAANWESAFEPNVADFRRVWNAWDFWAEANRVDPADAPRAGMTALMPAPSRGDGLNLRAFRAQLGIFETLGAFVCCDCAPMFSNGSGNTAIFSLDEQFWICAADMCDFRQKVEATAPVSRVRAAHLAREFDLDTAGMSSNDWQTLFEMLRWLDGQTPPRRISPRTYSALWDEFQSVK